MHATIEASPVLEHRRRRRLRDMERRHALGLPLTTELESEPLRKPYRPRKRMQVVGTVRGMYRVLEELSPKNVVTADDRMFLCECTKCLRLRHLTFKQTIERICPCSHDRPEPDVEDLTFHYLAVIGVYRGKKDTKQGFWVRCRCKCGSIIITRLSGLKAGRSKSCGCMQKEKARERRSEKGDLYRSREYAIWLQLKCGSTSDKVSSWKSLGAKGLKLCDRWAESYETFLAEVGRSPEGTGLYRLDATKDYEPGNVRWMTKKEHALLNNPLHTVDGVTDTMRGVCLAFDIKFSTVMYYVRKGKTFEEAVRFVRGKEKS